MQTSMLVWRRSSGKSRELDALEVDIDFPRGI
jgi:hypothetical protein